MKNITILPADTYTVINKTTITSDDHKIISMLYQPIIGYTAASLYFTLVDDLDKSEVMSEEFTHHHLMTIMQLKLDDIVIAREKLEAIGLLKTYYKKENINNYVYLLYSPISAHEFFNHPILNVVLYNNLGKKEYEKLLNYFKIPHPNLKDYEDITCNFNDVFSTIPSTNMEYDLDIAKKNSNKLEINKDIDFNLLIESIPNNLVNDKTFNDDVKDLIKALSFTYKINTLTMKDLLMASINEKCQVDKSLLRKNCRNYYQFENNGSLPTLIYNKQPEFLKKPVGDNSKWAKMVYTFENISPYQLLKAKYKGAEPTDHDKKIVENLLIDQKLNPGVVNVLLSYILTTNNQQLKKSYVETIAGQWKRLNIETVEDAMKLTVKEYKKIKNSKTPKTKATTSTNNTKGLPAWFNKDLETTTISSDEEQEMSDILAELV